MSLLLTSEGSLMCSKEISMVTDEVVLIGIVCLDSLVSN